MQQRVDTLTREVFDLQETVNWKDKKIGVRGQNEQSDCNCMRCLLSVGQCDFYPTILEHGINNLNKIESLLNLFYWSVCDEFEHY